MVAKGVITAIKTSEEISSVQLNLLADTTQDDVEFWQHFGFTSAPPLDENTRALMVSVAGNQDHGVVIATENGKFRVKDLNPGESCVYSEFGDKIHFKNGRIIDIQTETLNITSSKELNINSPKVKISGEIEASNVKDSQGSLGVLRDWSTTHTHISAAPGSPSSPPAAPLPPG